MEPYKDLKTLLNDALEMKNINHARLSELTGVPERYIWAIQNMEINKLPPSPYIYGYIKKISQALHIDSGELWELYKKELSHKTSGKYDRLPANRFVIKHLSKNKQLLIVLGGLIALYLIFSLVKLYGETNIIITNPDAPIISVSENIITLAGETKQRNKLTINNEEVFINSDGTFLKEFTLQPGLNDIEFKVKKFLGKEETITKQVLYQPMVDKDE